MKIIGKIVKGALKYGSIAVGSVVGLAALGGAGLYAYDAFTTRRENDDARK